MRLTFTQVVLRKDGAAPADDLRVQTCIRRIGNVFAVCKAVAIFNAKTVIKIIVGLVIKRNVQVGSGYDLRRLGIDQLKDIIKGQGHIDALGNAGQGVHFLYALLKVGDRLNTLDGNRGLVAQVFQKAQIAGRIGLSNKTRSQGQPAGRFSITRQCNKEARSQ